jgi:hypothetical protein
MRLAAAYALAGQKQLVFFIAETTIDDKYGHYYYYGSSERNKAMTLEL